MAKPFNVVEYKSPLLRPDRDRRLSGISSIDMAAAMEQPLPGERHGSLFRQSAPAARTLQGGLAAPMTRGRVTYNLASLDEFCDDKGGSGVVGRRHV